MELRSLWFTSSAQTPQLRLNRHEVEGQRLLLQFPDLIKLGRINHYVSKTL